MNRQCTWRLSAAVALALASALGTGCSTPYKPAVVVGIGTASEFDGIGSRLGDAALDVVIVHGMCSQQDGWADAAVDQLSKRLGPFVEADDDKGVASSAPATAPADSVEVIRRPGTIGGHPVRFWALHWGRMTRPLKDELLYDKTASAPSACTGEDAAACKPQRASLNAALKDGLLNDCLADALIYQGARRGPAMRAAMVDALRVVAAGAGADGPLVVVSSSLGSKITLDAMRAMLEPSAAPNALAATPGLADATAAAGARLAGRLASVYMLANQVPILALADAAGDDTAAALDVIASRRAQAKSARGERFDALQVVAFSDPNDLLSYQLAGAAKPASLRVRYVDVLVSNAASILGLLEDPRTAHGGYLNNDDVACLIVRGHRAGAGPCR